MAVDGDLIQGWKRNFSESSMSFCKIPKPDAVVTADSNDLSLKEFLGPFLLFFIGIALSVFVFIYEQFKIYYETKRRRNSICPEQIQISNKYTYRRNTWFM